MPVPPAARLTLVGLRERVRPAGEPVPDRVTVPTKLLRLVRVIVEVAVEPVFKLTELGLADRLKSPVLVEPTLTVMVV